MWWVCDDYDDEGEIDKEDDKREDRNRGDVLVLFRTMSWENARKKWACGSPLVTNSQFDHPYGQLILTLAGCVEGSLPGLRC